MKLAICDDDMLFLESLLGLCREVPFVSDIRRFEKPEALLTAVRDGFCPDALLMDIDLGTARNGIDYMAELFSINAKIRIIYITGYTDRFVQYVFLQPSALAGFLTKPVQPELLRATLQKVQKLMDEEKHTLLCLSGRDTAEAIPCGSISYLESSAHRVHIHTDSGCCTVYERLEVLASRLPSSFLRCHKSFLVNMAKIQRIEKNQILLKDGSSVQISKSRFSETKKHYFEYMRMSL